MIHGRAMPPVGHLVFKTSEVPLRCLVGSTPTSSANIKSYKLVLTIIINGAKG